MEPIIIKDNRVKQYEIEFTENYSTLKEKMSVLLPDLKKAFLIVDSNVDKQYGKELTKALKGIEITKYVVKSGEESKKPATINEIEEALFNAGITRSDAVIGFGGGVTLDIAGFAASIYMRGIPFISLPTTLLSMADASVGGKDGINYMGTKNIIGSFYMPKYIMMNLNTLNTLDGRNFYAGFAEIMKEALIADSKFYVWLIDNMYEICEKDYDTICQMLSKAINIKKIIVEKDPYEETGERMLLNFGHTIGHGIESVLGDEYIHGECVSLGCVAASYISYKMNFISSDDYYEIRDMFVPFYLPISISTEKTDEILNAVLKDKKHTSDKHRMVLLKRVGKAFVSEDVDVAMIKEAIDELNFKDED